MADYSLSAELKLKCDQFKKGINQSQQALKGLSKELKNVIGETGKNGLQGTLSSVTKGTSALTAVMVAELKVLKNLKKAIVEYSDVYRTQLNSENQLAIAIQNNPMITGQATKRMKEFASALQMASNYGDEKLLPMMSQLIASGRTETEVQKIMQTAIDLSSTGMMSLETAVQQLNATLNGNIGRLGMQNAELKKLTKEELANGKAVDILAKKYEGLGKANKNSSVQLKNLQGDFKEAIGRITFNTSEYFNQLFAKIYKGATDTINRIEDYIDVKKIGKNINENVRTRAKELQEKYGGAFRDVLKNPKFIEDTVKDMSDRQLQIYSEWLSMQKELDTWQKSMLVLINSRLKSAETFAKYDAKELQNKTLIAEKENTINDIIKDARENIEKQKIEWESISAIKGEQISDEEKLAFYEDNLVDALKESGGLNEQNKAFYEEQLGIIKKIRDNLEKPINNTWKKKIEELRLEGLEEYSSEAHEIRLGMIDDEESETLATAQTEKEKSDIRTFYNNKREKENERMLKGIREKEEKERKKVIEGIIATSKGAINLTKGMVKGMAKAFETIGSAVKKVISGIKSMVSISMNALKKIVDFSVDDSLQALLEFEDGILTFFVETLPRLPQFLESAFNSVSVLLSSLANSMNLDKMEKTFSSIITTITDKAPTTFGNLVTLVTRTFTSIGNTIRNNAGSIVNAFGEMFLSVGNALPSVVDTFFGTVFSLLSNFGLWLTKNKDKIETIVSNVISTVVTNIKEFIKNKGWKRLLTGLLDLQKALESAVSDNIEDIGEVISDALPDLATFLKNSIISASKTVAKVAPTLLKALGEIIGTLFQVAFDPEVIESSFDAIGGIISGLVQAIVAFISKLIPSIIKGLIEAPKAIPQLIAGIIGGLIDGLTKADWDEVLNETFQAFIDGFKNLFGINSPSKLFEEFGGYIVEGLEIGLRGFVDVINAILDPIKTVLDNLTDMKSLGEGLKAVFEGISDVAKTMGKVTIAIMGAVGQSLVDVYNVISQIVKEITSIKIVTPWKTYSFGGVDLGKVDAPDVQPYIDLITALDGAKYKSGIATVAGSQPQVVNPYYYTNPESYNNTGVRAPINTASGLGNSNTFNVTFNNVQDTSVYNAVSQLKQYNRELAINGVI